MTRLTKRRLDAMLSAVVAMLAGEGEGDAEGVNFADLEAAADWISEQLRKRESRNV